MCIIDATGCEVGHMRLSEAVQEAERRGQDWVFIFGSIREDGWVLDAAMCFVQYQDAQEYLEQFPSPGRMLRRWRISTLNFG